MTGTRVACLLLVTMTWCLLSAGTTRGAATIVVGDYELLPDRAGQIITLTATGDELVRGLNLRAQMGDGLEAGIEPSFDGVDFGSGLWDAHAYTTLGGPVGDAPQFLQASVVFNETGETVSSAGVIARLSISTIGLTTGVFDLRLAQTQIGEDTDFIRVGGSSVVPAITNGTVRIIPEPSSALLALLGSLALLTCRRTPWAVGTEY